MNKRAKNKKNKNIVITRHGVEVLAAIVLLIVTIAVISASYSWFEPQNADGTGMRYSFDGLVRSENCSMRTYEGIKLDASNRLTGEYIDQIRYNSSSSSGSVSISSGTTKYFKTEIINADTKYASDISLFISTMPGGTTVSVTFPSNTVRILNTDVTDFALVRDAFVKRHDTHDVNGPGLLTIEWFVTNNSSSSVTVDLSNLYLSYN